MKCSKCSVSSCKQQVQIGDIYFCSIHRIQWQFYCLQVGYNLEPILKEEIIKEKLSRWCNKTV